MVSYARSLSVAAALVLLAGSAFGQALPAETRIKAEARAKALAAWGVDPTIVAAVKARNRAPETQAMTQEKWKSLTVLDPLVRSFTRNPLAAYLKTKKDDSMTEIFVSGADGTKTAFLSKPSNWSHKGKDKHDVPMKGRTWIGSLEVDESSGAQQVQIAVPVLDGNRPIGSIVVGIKGSSL